MERFGSSRFDPYGFGFYRPRLGQTSSDLDARAAAAILKYQALGKRLALIKDPASVQAIQVWLGLSDMPGSPADQFWYVQQEQAQGAPWDASRMQHLMDLEATNQQFETRVSAAEQSGTASPSGPIGVTDSAGKLTGVGIGLVTVAALGLMVIPFMLKD